MEVLSHLLFFFYLFWDDARFFCVKLFQPNVIRTTFIHIASKWCPFGKNKKRNGGHIKTSIEKASVVVPLNAQDLRRSPITVAPPFSFLFSIIGLVGVVHKNAFLVPLFVIIYYSWCYWPTEDASFLSDEEQAAGSLGNEISWRTCSVTSDYIYARGFLKRIRIYIFLNVYFMPSSTRSAILTLPPLQPDS